MTTRDALVKELISEFGEDILELKYLDYEKRHRNIVDFILARDKKNAEPLVNCKDYMQNQKNLWPTYERAINETLKNLGAE